MTLNQAPYSDRFPPSLAYSKHLHLMYSVGICPYKSLIFKFKMHWWLIYVHPDVHNETKFALASRCKNYCGDLLINSSETFIYYQEFVSNHLHFYSKHLQ